MAIHLLPRSSHGVVGAVGYAPARDEATRGWVSRLPHFVSRGAHHHIPPPRRRRRSDTDVALLDDDLLRDRMPRLFRALLEDDKVPWTHHRSLLAEEMPIPRGAVEVLASAPLCRPAPGRGRGNRAPHRAASARRARAGSPAAAPSVTATVKLGDHLPPPSQFARRPRGLALTPSAPARSGPCRAGLSRARVRRPCECASWLGGGVGEGRGTGFAPPRLLQPPARRRMPFQAAPHEENKLASCIRGEIYDVVLDLRAASPSYRRWHAPR